MDSTRKKIFFGIYSSLKEDETNDVGKNLQIKKGLFGFSLQIIIQEEKNYLLVRLDLCPGFCIKLEAKLYLPVLDEL